MEEDAGSAAEEGGGGAVVEDGAGWQQQEREIGELAEIAKRMLRSGAEREGVSLCSPDWGDCIVRLGRAEQVCGELAARVVARGRQQEVLREGVEAQIGKALEQQEERIGEEVRELRDRLHQAGLDSERQLQRRKQNLCIMAEMQSNWFMRRRGEEMLQKVRAE